MANKIIIMITVALATCSFFVGCGKDNSVQLSGESSNESVLESDGKKQEAENDNIYVYVNGQVKYPGVYKLKNGDRAYKAIKKAGGLTKNAKKNNINLAETVVDAQNIYVMSKKEYKKSLSKKGVSDELEGNLNENQDTDGSLININTADESELTKLPGIGNSKAAAIIKYREENGNFSLKEDIKKEVGFDLDVVLCGSHDTASAVMAVPESTGESVYISSGTWSLMGIESKKAIINDEARLANFTNEGGYDHRFRFLKNIMGLWMIQSIRHEYNDAYSFAQLCELAQENKDFPSRVDVNDDKFLSPDNMTQAVQNYCKETGQRVPETIGELAEVVYQSLAICYKKAIHNLEEIAGKTYNSIHIIGGGSNATYLNQLTANATGKKIYAGPSEASALGNMLAQMIRNEEFTSLQNARICVFDSFDIKKYIPEKENK